jgi:hypothetical protein
MKHSLTRDEIHDIVLGGIALNYKELIQQEGAKHLPRKCNVRATLGFKDGEIYLNWWVEPRD